MRFSSCRPLCHPPPPLHCRIHDRDLCSKNASLLQSASSHVRRRSSISSESCRLISFLLAAARKDFLSASSVVVCVLSLPSLFSFACYFFRSSSLNSSLTADCCLARWCLRDFSLLLLIVSVEYSFELVACCSQFVPFSVFNVTFVKNVRILEL